MSVFLSVPTISASNCLLSLSVTIISSASSITCALVMMSPSSAFTITPEPRPLFSLGSFGMRPPKKRSRSSSFLLDSLGALAVLLTLIDTTAGVILSRSGAMLNTPLSLSKLIAELELRSACECPSCEIRHPINNVVTNIFLGIVAVLLRLSNIWFICKED